MTAEIRTKMVRRYYCSVCGTGWQNGSHAKRHVAEGCYLDPETRACPTCVSGWLNEPCLRAHGSVKAHCETYEEAL